MTRTFPLRAALGAALLVTAAQGSALAQSVVLEPSKDNTLIEEPSGGLSNGAGQVFFAGRVRGTGGGTFRRAVMAFDLSSIPAGATVTSAALRLRVIQSPNVSTFDFDLHRLTADWGEGTSSTAGGIGAFATTDDATWIHTFWPGAFWTNAGGDFVGTSSATTSIAGPGLYTFTSSQLAADVQDWLDGAAGNYGWILIGDESTLASARVFGSREAVPADRPQLTVEYTTSCGTVAAVAFRNGGTNPASLTAGTMVLGSTFTASVDNNLAGQAVSALFAFDTAFMLTLSGGQTLLCLDLGSSGELLTGGGLTPSSSVGGIDSYSLPIPNDPGLCGFTLSVQAIQFGAPPFAMSNAQDLTIGS